VKLLFLTNVPSPYRVEFFNELGKHCNLTVLYEKQRSEERHEMWMAQAQTNYQSVYLRGISTGADTAFCPNVLQYLKKNIYDHIIVCSISTPTGILALEYLKLMRIPYALEGDGGFAKNGIGPREWYKKHLIKGAQFYFSTSGKHDEYYLQYGAEPRHIVRYPFTSLTEEDILKKPVTPEAKRQIRNRLNIKEEKCVLSVGQFIYRKGYDVLLQACSAMARDIGFYIIGGEPTCEYLEYIKMHSLDNIHFIGFKTKDELKEYYKAADLFVLPTREDIWGLVINEAMANGLPVVSTDKCIAALELVEDGINGYIIPVENAAALVNRMINILRDCEIRIQMAENNLRKAQSYTFEKMAQCHFEVLNHMGCVVER